MAIQMDERTRCLYKWLNFNTIYNLCLKLARGEVNPIRWLCGMISLLYFSAYLNRMDIKIIPYNKVHHPTFKALNLEWLERFNLKEDLDVAVLSNPEELIIEPGGFVWVALDNDSVIGTAALIKEHDGIYELAKMSVAESYRGKGISKLLIETCIAKARELNAEKLLLFSNSQLQTAIKLYEKYGFNHIAVEDSPFTTADVKMELVF